MVKCVACDKEATRDDAREWISLDMTVQAVPWKTQLVKPSLVRRQLCCSTTCAKAVASKVVREFNATSTS